VVNPQPNGINGPTHNVAWRDERERPATVRSAVDQLSAILERGVPLGDSHRGVLSVEVGGSGLESITGRFERPQVIEIASTVPHETAGMYTCFAAPGFVTGGRVQGAHQLSWMDVNGWAELGLRGEPDLGMNDAEAAALGEWILGDKLEADLIYVGLGTGVGSARVINGEVVAFEFGHRPGYRPKVCQGCGNTCVSGQIGGETLPSPLTAEALNLVVTVLAAAILDSDLPPSTSVIIGGGIARTYPPVISLIQIHTGRHIQPTRAGGLKSAASVTMFDRAVRQ
jgi:hypothetical protein